MSNSENDENIRVNIRTGTSTRVPRPRPSNINEVKSDNSANHIQRDFPLEITIEFDDRTRIVTALLESMQQARSYQQLVSLMNSANRENDYVLNTVLSRSMQDTELHRNPSVVLDIHPHHCKTTEMDGNCSVCQSKFKLGEKLSTLLCDHTFHYDCLQEWGKYKAECPLCRSGIPILER